MKNMDLFDLSDVLVVSPEVRGSYGVRILLNSPRRTDERLNFEGAVRSICNDAKPGLLMKYKDEDNCVGYEMMSQRMRVSQIQKVINTLQLIVKLPVIYVSALHDRLVEDPHDELAGYELEIDASYLSKFWTLEFRQFLALDALDKPAGDWLHMDEQILRFFYVRLTGGKLAPASWDRSSLIANVLSQAKQLREYIEQEVS